MIKFNLQLFGGRGSGGGKGGGGSGGQVNTQNQTNSRLSMAMEESPGMREYSATKVLDEAPVGTKVYTGDTSINSSLQRADTFWEKTSSYGWTRFGDTTNYDAISSNRVAKELNKRKTAGSLNLRVTG